MTGATRRSRRREETVAEIRSLALEQVVAGGPDAVSLNAIAGGMRMSPAAIYRYFDNRDALLADLVVDFYDSLAEALEAVPAELPAVARAYRGWALVNPNGYRLIFQTTSGSGIDLAPERTIPAATRSMVVLLAAVAGRPVSVAGGPKSAVGGPVSAVGGSVSVAGGPKSAVGGPLAAQLRDWAARTELPDMAEGTLALGLACWTRLHGVISLELGHHLASTGIDPGLLYESEITALLTAAGPPARHPDHR